MPRVPDFEGYHRSIQNELLSKQNRVRALIQDAHWLTDGEWKEAALRSQLRQHLLETSAIGKGFIIGSDWVSSQLDILILNKDEPIVFHDGDLYITTPECVDSIIEVKTKANTHVLCEALNKLSIVIGNVRRSLRGQTDVSSITCGLFSYESSIDDLESIMIEIAKQSTRQIDRQDKLDVAVNYICLGPNLFIRFWEHSSDEQHGLPSAPAWHAYFLKDTSFTYFIGNLSWDASSAKTRDSERAWFPLKDGKRAHRLARVTVEGEYVEERQSVQDRRRIWRGKL